MVKYKMIAVLFTAALLVPACKTASNKGGAMKDGSGKVIGRYDVLNDHDAKANWDMNQNGISERVSSYKDNSLTNVEYYDDANGAKTKSVNFANGKPSDVVVYDKEGKAVRGNVAIDQNTNAGREVVLPSKNKRVTFNGDGTTTVAPVETK